MKRTVTIREIAEYLGSSKSTVARALSNNCSNVKTETQQKIQEAAKQLGYKLGRLNNPHSRHTKSIGIIVPELVTSFYADFITKVQSIVYEKGYHIIIYGT